VNIPRLTRPHPDGAFDPHPFTPERSRLRGESTRCSVCHMERSNPEHDAPTLSDGTVPYMTRVNEAADAVVKAALVWRHPKKHKVSPYRASALLEKAVDAYEKALTPPGQHRPRCRSA
jgi:hypothetical protein